MTYLDLGIVNVREDLSKVAHVDRRAADRAIAQTIDFGLGDGVRAIGRTEAWRNLLD